MFSKLGKNKTLLIIVAFLLLVVVICVGIGFVQKNFKKTGTEDNKIEYGEDVTVENDTPGLDVKEDDGKNDNGVSVPESWEENTESTTPNNTGNGSENTDDNIGNDSTNTDNDNADDDTTEKDDSDEESDEDIIEDDKSWGIIF